MKLFSRKRSVSAGLPYERRCVLNALWYSSQRGFKSFAPSFLLNKKRFNCFSQAVLYYEKDGGETKVKKSSKTYHITLLFANDYSCLLTGTCLLQPHCPDQCRYRLESLWPRKELTISIHGVPGKFRHEPNKIGEYVRTRMVHNLKASSFSTIAIIMLSSASGASPPQPIQLQSLQINNERNNGLIGDGSNNIVTVNSGNVIIQMNDESEDVLDKLLDRYLSKDALHNSFHSSPECYLNTRTTVCNEIGQWIDESGSENSPLLWLNGPAGVGKTAVAKTISVLRDQVAATFFFSTSSDRSATTLFPTLAWQLARSIPETREHIIAALKNNGSPQTSQIEEQFDPLILRPLKSITTLGYRPVMVIDGVDECIDESMLVRFLRVLVRAGEGGSVPVRFMICSRPEQRIRAILGRTYHVNPTTNEQEIKSPSLLSRVLHLAFGVLVVGPRWAESEPHPGRGFATFLQDVRELYRPIRLGFDKHAPSSSELTDTLDRICPHAVISTIQIGFSEECKQDMAKYLTDMFGKIPPPGDGTSPWFRPCDISDLVEASCGQFLYASTISRLLDESHIDPRDILEMAHRGSLPTPDLNKLYKAILKRAEDTMRNQAQGGGPDYQTEWRHVMDSLKMLVFFAGNVHYSTVSQNFPVIESLLGLERGRLARKLDKMNSVLSIVPGASIRIHHRSFLEFLQSQERSGEYHISFSTALRRILFLLRRAGRRYSKNDSRRHCIEEMVVTDHRNFFGRFRHPRALYLLHLIIYTLIITTVFAVPISLITRYTADLRNRISFFPFAGLFTVVDFFAICISFFLSLTASVFFSNRSITVLFLHPFLHFYYKQDLGSCKPVFIICTLVHFCPYSRSCWKVKTKNCAWSV
ncbi:hypothetical protein M378DRAFT_673910 [Amanita muscaria Koide BX008]|uniref:Nephrocystin 3-like N-terminal domain-containing protein n=1 Tax=Amanita muscaria (strain Koide BX008) TaxID=946122 RepID=A0A0C2T9E0_AMAMK|nr:hypothetical protein M378DRAFT_673910 [Amanita muscaria Koide BX008]